MVSSSERDRRRRIAQRARHKQFERLVEAALRTLPPEIHAMLDNLDIVLADEPTARQLAGWDDEDGELLGLYEGTPRTERSSFSLPMPDKITIFIGPLERSCDTREEMAEEVRITVLHEIAHHFGIDEARLEELGLG